MGKRQPNLRRIKRLRQYTVEELALLLEVHKNTVRRWQRIGLTPIDDRRPTLFRGEDVVSFLQEKRTKSKRPCGPGEIYCLKCRAPRRPDGNIAELAVTGPSNACLIGICPICTSMLYRQLNPSRIEAARGTLELCVRIGEAHIADTAEPTLNGDFKAREPA